jgi:quinol monooxygenase YgiN
MMVDERGLENMIERVPAAPDRIIALRSYTVQPGSESAFEAMWREFVAEQSKDAGFLLQRLHRDLEHPSHFVAYEVWPSRLALIGALRNTTEFPAYPLAGSVHQTFVRLTKHVPGQLRDANYAQAGQVVSIRRFYLKVNSQPIFERLWVQSAQAEVHREGCLYKRLHRDLNLPTHYVSYSLWAHPDAVDEAAHNHAHWQAAHEPYPLSSPVVRQTLEVRTNIAVSAR